MDEDERNRVNLRRAAAEQVIRADASWRASHRELAWFRRWVRDAQFRRYASTSIGGPMRKVPLPAIAFGILLFSASKSSACLCGAITAAQGFDQAQAVFSGKVIKAKKSTWTVVVDRVWKGEVEERITLHDALPGSSCAGGYERGESYLFLINVEESEHGVVYSPQICNWGTRLKSTKVEFEGSPATLIEDLVLKDRGAGKPPMKKVPKQKMNN
jgi:hypothetical protein